MSRALLDVNVLVALLDSDHADHARASGWIADNAGDGWSSCAITQNGFVRVISQPRYPSPIAPVVAIELLSVAAAHPSHEFWPCDLSILNPAVVTAERVHGPRQVTDCYLLALAVQHRGRLATFDQNMVLGAVPGATPDHLAVI